MTTFGEVLEALKSGKRAYRKGWNGIEAGKEMFIYEEDSIGRNYPELLQSETRLSKWFDTDRLEHLQFSNFLVLYIGNVVVPGWLASQTDMIAEDWVILEE